MVRRNLIPSSMYNEWAFDLIQQNPYHATVWRSSLPAIEYNHSLIERLPARRCCEPGSGNSLISRNPSNNPAKGETRPKRMDTYGIVCHIVETN